MALRNIVVQGDDVLGKKAREVTEYNKRLHILLDDMKETLINANGLGLAAPQVGILRRVVLVVDTNLEDLPYEEQVIELINPVIVEQSGEQDGTEGCLSVPGKYGFVTRPNFVRVKAFDRNGNPFEITGEGLTARAYCHELEHLDGHLFVEHCDRLYTEEELRAMDDDDYEEED